MALTDKKRLEKLLPHLQLTKYSLSKKLGFANGSVFNNIWNERNGISAKLAKKICDQFPEINFDWLLTGKGEMLNAPKKESTPQSLIPMYDVEAVGGSDLADTSAITKPTRMINIGDFLKDSQAAIRVYGNSMLPGYPSGCIIGTREVSGSVLEWGEVYVVETQDARYIKRLYQADNGITCYSDNTKGFTEGPRKGKPLYEPFNVPKDEIIRMHRVVGVIKRNDNSAI